MIKVETEQPRKLRALGRVHSLGKGRKRGNDKKTSHSFHNLWIVKGNNQTSKIKGAVSLTKWSK